MTDPTPAEALKACPFCGGQPTRNDRLGVGGVNCSSPDHWVQAYGATQEDAEREWNTRHPPPDAGEVVRTEAVAQALAKESGVSDWAHVSEHGEYDSRDYWRRLARAAIAAIGRDYGFVHVRIAASA